MSFDAHTNLALSTIATAPSPATSGTSLVVAAGDGVIFPTPPFNATVWPTGVNPLSTNAEIVRVTAIATDTLTIVRSQESSNNRSILVGDQIAATVTAKTMTDLEKVQGLVNCAPDASISVPASYALVVVRKYSLATGIKVSLGDGAFLRIL